MNTLINDVRTKQREYDAGYALYVANQSIALCKSDEERRGWRAAQKGHMAAVTVEVAFAIGSDADYALKGAW